MTVQTPELVLEHGAHAVHLYESDAELAERVGGLMRHAVERGCAVVVIATEPHREAFGLELAHAGIDLDRSIVMLDAAATLGRFMSDGRLDAAAFDDVIGGLLREARAAGRQIWAYGEMVALLWERGDVVDAIELEALWNDLGRALPFALHCGYPSSSALAPEHEEALRRVCSLHSAVVAHDEVCANFPARSDSPRAIRRMVANALRRWGHGERLVQSVQLVASELATNAVIHTGRAFSLRVVDDAHVIRIEVRDHSAEEPSARDPGRTAPSGRGLWLVDQLAVRWGAEAAADGKTVWAEI